ncbi:MAG: ParB/RepB/Spo0J family partition protein [Candidatus Omnitrophica bacterium]|nr:ParB/RepB/Spo0J family partition protein [Candidatus Omnitrophota bacterium]
MTTKRLGRGLADIISGTVPQGAPDLVALRVDQIRPGRFQPRTDVSEAALEELKASIRRSGIVAPVIVRPVAHGTYELVAGERRFRAAQALALPQIPAIIKPLSDKEALELSLVENVQREDLNPMEEARGYARLLAEFGYTQEDVASAIGKDRATVANLLRLLTLPDEIQRGLREGAITLGHAKAILGAEGRPKQLELYQLVRRRDLTVRQTEALAVTLAPGRRRRAHRVDPQLAGLEDELRRALGTKVRLVARQKGGRIIVEYFSAEDLARLLQLLGVGDGSEPRG